MTEVRDAEEVSEAASASFGKSRPSPEIMAGMSGPDLQRELKLRGWEIPIIFITASTDKTVRSRLLEQGAVECLFKPFSDTTLLNAVNSALHPK
jgi:FixJ family two-component response regulator